MAAMIEGQTLRVHEVAAMLGLPGSWTVRRLEARGVLPRAHRTRVLNKRYYFASELPLLRRRLALGPKRYAPR